MVQSPFNLSALASHEQVYAVVLRLQNSKKRLAEGFLGTACALARNRYGFICARCCLVLDQVFEIVIVDVDCAGSAVSWCEMRCMVSDVTHSGPIQECSFVAMYRRIS